MIEYPWFLLLLLLFVLYWWYRKVRKFYFRHPYLQHVQSKGGEDTIKFVPLVAFLFLIAACNFVWKTKEVTKTYLAHKYVLVNDGSGSMVNGSKENGIGDELTAVLSGNDKLFDVLGKRKDGTKDLVGAIVFSNDAFVVSNLSEDPQFVQRKLKRIDYRAEPMNQGTDIEAGLWAGVDMLLSYKDVVPEKDLNHLQIRFLGMEHHVKMDPVLESIVAKKEHFKGGSIIIFTDGIFDPRGSEQKMSSYKIINFCKMLGIRVYFISIFNLDSTIIEYSRATGGRGEIVKSGYDKRRLEQIYEEIASSQAAEYEMKEQMKDNSISGWIGLYAFFLLVIGLIWRSVVQLEFTEV